MCLVRRVSATNSILDASFRPSWPSFRPTFRPCAPVSIRAPFSFPSCQFPPPPPGRERERVWYTLIHLLTSLPSSTITGQYSYLSPSSTFPPPRQLLRQRPQSRQLQQAESTCRCCRRLCRRRLPRPSPPKVQSIRPFAQRWFDDNRHQVLPITSVGCFSLGKRFGSIFQRFDRIAAGHTLGIEPFAQRSLNRRVSLSSLLRPCGFRLRATPFIVAARSAGDDRHWKSWALLACIGVTRQQTSRGVILGLANKGLFLRTSTARPAVQSATARKTIDGGASETTGLSLVGIKEESGRNLPQSGRPRRNLTGTFSFSPRC